MDLFVFFRYVYVLASVVQLRCKIKLIMKDVREWPSIQWQKNVLSVTKI